MDVYISEEYIMQRRIEKKKAANVTRNSDGARRFEMEKMARPKTRKYTINPTATVFGENNDDVENNDVVFSCFSA